MRFLILVSLVLPRAVEAQHVQQFGELRYRRLVDELTDADRSIIYTDDVTATITRTGAFSGRTGRTVWRCQGATLEVFLRSDSLPVDSALIRWRVDDHDASPEEVWRQGTSGLSMFAPQGSAARLTMLAKVGERLVIRLRDPESVSYDFTFSLEGAGEAIGHLACDPTGTGPGPTHTEAGTTPGMRGWYTSNSLLEEQWVYAPEGYMPPGLH